MVFNRVFISQTVFFSNTRMGNIFQICHIMKLNCWPTFIVCWCWIRSRLQHLLIQIWHFDMFNHFAILNFSHGCALINRLNNEFMFNITGSILEYNESGGILENANASSCISYDRCSLDNVSSNMYTAATWMGCKAIRRITANVRGKFFFALLFFCVCYQYRAMEMLCNIFRPFLKWFQFCAQTWMA